MGRWKRRLGCYAREMEEDCGRPLGSPEASRRNTALATPGVETSELRTCQMGVVLSHQVWHWAAAALRRPPCLLVWTGTRPSVAGGCRFTGIQAGRPRRPALPASVGWVGLSPAQDSTAGSPRGRPLSSPAVLRNLRALALPLFLADSVLLKAEITVYFEDSCTVVSMVTLS